MCVICRFAFNGCPPGVKFPGDDCPPVWGKCGHCFHLQCINEWLQTASNNNTCISLHSINASPH
uniref:Anaphase-promoting complex subunit 11 n=1 Tax=Arcella intermedia TaxID=1963864 RepID=A0A6B2LWI2_9EUKA